ncbi:MAG: formyltransferase family protein [Alphaproteobacteria bacterium]
MTTQDDPDDTIILLTGDVEAPFLGDRLLALAPRLSIEHAADLERLQELLKSPTPGRRRLIAFCTGVLVPGELLEILGGPAYNFHPGPPDYPGNHAAGFALYEDARRFGATAHVMEAETDSGDIIGTETFDIPAGCDRQELEILAYQAILALFDKLAPELIDLDRELAAIDARWAGKTTTSADLEAMYQGWSVLDETERQRRSRAFGAPNP